MSLVNFPYALQKNLRSTIYTYMCIPIMISYYYILKFKHAICLYSCLNIRTVIIRVILIHFGCLGCTHFSDKMTNLTPLLVKQLPNFPGSGLRMYKVII